MIDKMNVIYENKCNFCPNTNIITEGEEGQDKIRQDKTRQDKTRQDKTRQLIPISLTYVLYPTGNGHTVFLLVVLE